MRRFLGCHTIVVHAIAAISAEARHPDTIQVGRSIHDYEGVVLCREPLASRRQHLKPQSVRLSGLVGQLVHRFVTEPELCECCVENKRRTFKSFVVALDAF